MEIIITFEKDRITLPIASNEVIQGLIYHAIGVDNKYSTQVHDGGNTFDGRNYKLFTFGELKGKYEVQGKTITYLSSVTLKIRANDSYFIKLLYFYFTRNSNVRLGNNIVTVKEVNISDYHITENQIEIRTLSPITIYATNDEGKTTYYTPNDKEFYQLIINNAYRKYQSCVGEKEDLTLEIFTLPTQKYVKRATSFKSTYITAYHGSFILKGTPELLDFLYHTGLGSKNSQGFGMFQIR
ncbi:MAG: CRISPR-associated endoribonuclease Cas6 [Clostridia bacterium]|nr:CRISPR-associated endoribonuclease Cas6 [Clostridia bacterium]